MFLFSGQIISSKNNSDENEIIKFDQLNIDLSLISQLLQSEAKTTGDWNNKTIRLFC